MQPPGHGTAHTDGELIREGEVPAESRSRISANNRGSAGAWPSQESVSSRPTGVTRRAAEILEQIDILRNPYFLALQSGEMNRAGFLDTQQQFYFAVLEFPRAMLNLLAKFPHPAQRLGILDNVLEEHGRFQPDAFHEATFRQFLASLSNAECNPRPLCRGPEVDAFNLALMGACHFESIEFGTACLGIIELAFADISATIGQSVVRREWVPADDLVHYKMHAEIDRDHAAEMFAVLEPAWNDSARRGDCERGLQLGAYIFDRLYRDLWQTTKGTEIHNRDSSAISVARE